MAIIGKKEVDRLKKKLIVPCLCAAALLAGGWICRENFALEARHFVVKSSRVPEGFDGFRIAHVSDVHNSRLAENGGKLLELLKKAEPDMIAVTGDLIDSRRTDMALALRFMEEALEIAPCYFAPGNHESRIEGYGDFAEKLEAMGVDVLADESCPLEQNGDIIRIIGLSDPAFHWENELEFPRGEMSERLWYMTEEEDDFTLLLSHRPDLIDIYASCGVDLVLSGHAHGGQIRIPGLGGLIAPHQGWFPEYYEGLHGHGDTQMVISRGIGNSLFPFRVNDRPEVPVIELKHE